MEKGVGFLAMATLAAAAAFGFLLSPAPARPVVCAQDVRLTRALGFPLNCDSRVFVGLAERPDAIFDAGGAGRTWQSRPLFVAAGALARAGWQTALDAAGLHPRVDDIDSAGWLGYVTINLFLLTAAMVVLAGIVRPWALSGPLVLVLASFLAANRVVKGFFWTPHTQIFNVLVPVLAIFWVSRELAPGVGTKPAPARPLLAGALALAYGGFLALGAALALARAVRSASVSQGVRRFVSALAATVVVPLAWVAGVKIATGSFYSYETRYYGEFVWIAAALRSGAESFRAAMTAHLGRFVTTAVPVIAFPAAALVGTAVLARTRGVRAADFSAEARRLLAACGCWLAVSLPFFALLGYYADRLAWNFVPPLLVATVVLAAEMRRRGSLSTAAFAAAASIVAAANFAILVLRPNA